MKNKSSLFKWITVGSMAILALVSLIMSSIQVHMISKSAGSGSYSDVEGHTEATMFLVFSLLGLVATGVGTFFALKNKKGLFLAMMGAALLLFVIGFAIVGSDANDAWKIYKDLPDNSSLVPPVVGKDMLEDWQVNAYRVFPVELTFILLCGLTSITTGVLYAKAEKMF